MAGVGSGGPEDSASPSLADLGEWELIRRLAAFAPPGALDDDAALLEVGPGTLVVNTDVLVEGVHFSDATTAAADAGWRAAAANLSDLAAMGCTEVVGLTVGLVAPAATPWNWVEGVYGGLGEALDRYGGTLLGGDCSSGAQRLLAITALGRLAENGGPIRRRDGRPGDWLVSTGPHGLSRLGLALLQEPAVAAATAAQAIPDLAERAIAAHQRPHPRFDAVRALIASRPASVAWRVGGCDSSDGLAAAVRAIAASSGCAARLERGALPLDPAMAALAEAEAWCLSGGEDFELVLTLEPGWAAAMEAALPSASRIGELVVGVAGELGWSDGGAWSRGNRGDGSATCGYRHFS